MEKFYIIDGHSHLYAAYYAIRGLTSPTGEPTNAVYGMTSVILKVLRDHQPDYIVAVFDPPGKTFRSQIYPEYKANRPPTPDDLEIQVTRIQQVLETLGIKILVIEGYEADDVIATLALNSTKKNMEVIICSKDKDLEQIISDKIKLYDTTKDKVTDLDTLFKEKGIKPTQVVDMLALVGDPIDNIPGVPGVGPKTAVKLIKEFGNIDEIIKNKDKLPPKVRDYLSDPKNIEKIYLSRKLVKLAPDVPISLNFDEWKPIPFDEDKLVSLFTELGFNRFLEQLGLAQKAREKQKQNLITSKAKSTFPSSQPLKFNQITSLNELRSLTEQWKKVDIISVDTETTDVDPMKANLVGIAFSADPQTGWYLPIRTMDNQHLDFDKVKQILKPILEDPRIKKVGQNIKYDLNVLRRYNIELKGIWFDTMIASYVLDPARPSHSMDYLAQQFLGYQTIKLKELIGTGRNQLTLDLITTSDVAEYSAEDAVITYNLYKVLDEKLKEEGLKSLFHNLEMPLLEVLADMEYAGVSIDTDKLAELSNKLADKIHNLTREIFNIAKHPFNIDSPKQLAEVLFDELKLPTVKQTRTGRSTDVEVLQSLAKKHPLPALILEYRQLVKLKNTYIDKLPEMINPKTGKIHTSFNQTVTATGRLSSSEPNLQNIPIKSEIGKEIRSAFVPEDRKNNFILTCDYSQIELRLLAHLSEDEKLIQAFLDDQDIHSFVASQIFATHIENISPEQRSIAKTVNFGIIYGQTPHGLAKTLGISRREAQLFIQNYFKQYPRVKEFTQKCIEQAKEKGYVETIMGRRRRIPEIHSRASSVRALGERTAINTVVQGSAADLIKLAMINIHQQIHQGNIHAKMLIQVHDELVFEIPQKNVEQTTQKITDLMTSAMKLKVPLKVDAGWGPNWLAGK